MKGPRTTGVWLCALGAWLCAFALGCGIKGPPRPPTAPAAPAPPGADGGVSLPGAKVSYRVGPPFRDATDFVLVWLADRAPSTTTRLLVERHVPHGAAGHDDGPACGQRHIVARLRATARLQWRVEAGAPPARYRLLHEDGSPAGEAIDATTLERR